MRLLIVDDECAICNGLKNLIDWKLEGFEQIDICSSAVEAIDFLNNNSVDLIITDIFMPEITGIEFAKMIKKQSPMIKFIILTGYDKFEYAQEAIEIGVQRYLLKPVFPEKLRKVVREIYSEIVRERKIKDWMDIASQKISEYMPVVVNQFWNDVVCGKFKDLNTLSARASACDVDISGDCFLCLAVRIIEQEAAEGCYDPLPLKIAVRQIMQEVFSESLVYVVDKDNAMQLAILRKNIDDLELESLRITIETNLDVSVCFGVGRTCKMVTKLADSASEAEEAVLSVSRMEKKETIRYEDLLLWKKEHVDYPYEFEKSVFDMIRYGDVFDENVISQFLSCILPPIVSNENSTLMLLQFLGALYRFSNEFSIALKPDFNEVFEKISKNTENDLRKFIKKILFTLFNEKNHSRQHFVDILVENAKKIMDTEYGDADLTVAVIAKKCCASPNYLSRIFHSKLNITCIEYLTNVRIEAAKKLLLTSQLKSYQIAEEVGYNNPNYFSALFKKYVGLSPREYREMAGGGSL